jgi:uncharacterized membrane protein YoaK (UPF0700 family)
MTPTQKSTRVQEGVAAVLAFIAGYIDAYTLLNYKVYASFMSGNTTQTGLHTGQWRLAEAGHSLLPIPAFVIGGFVATLLVAEKPPHQLRRLCGLVAALLSVSLAAAYLDPLAGWFGIILLSMAMGVMNTVLDHVGKQAVRIGFVTGDLLSLGGHLAQTTRRLPLSDSQGPWDTHSWRAALLVGVWSSFLTGAMLSGAGTGYLGHWILLPPALILLVVAVCDRDTRVSALPNQACSERVAGPQVRKIDRS